MNEFGLSVVVACIIAFAAVYIKDAIEKKREREDRDDSAIFARFETRSQGTTDVNDYPEDGGTI